MSRGVLAIVAAVCLAGGVGVWMMAPDGDEQTASHAEGEQPRGKARKKRRGGQAPATRDGSLDERVARLEAEVTSLRRELKTMKMRGAAAPRLAHNDADDAREADGDSPAFEGAVRDIIEADRAEAMERRTDAMRDRFSERRSETLDELAAATGLNKSQRESIDSLWETESEQLIPMFVAAREGERPFSEVREEAERIRSATDASVEDMLSPEQYETYQEMRPGPPRRGDRGNQRGGGQRG